LSSFGGGEKMLHLETNRSEDIIKEIHSKTAQHMIPLFFAQI